MRIWLLFLIVGLVGSCERPAEDSAPIFQTPYEISRQEETATYLQIVDFYLRLAHEFPSINVQTIGQTDSGHPLHLVTFNSEGNFNFTKIGRDKTIVFINNGIHPGESDGIDATMILFRDLASGTMESPSETVLVTIPVYNVGGALNRNGNTRVNQNGPPSYGFRGNTLNYDLNRDFIKVDSKNTRTFTEIFHLVDPDIFIDTHVSNGADYQYTLTHLFTQHNKLGGRLGSYLQTRMIPDLESSLAEADWQITPYVNVFNQPPEVGFAQFIDHPRYSTGYTTLWNTFGMMVETHMLKPYQQRVTATYALLADMLEIAQKEGDTIRQLREAAKSRHLGWEYYPTRWAVDTTRTTTFQFLGYEADTVPSEVTGYPRLRYDRTRPFTKPVQYRNYYVPTDSVKIPKAYVLRKGWSEVLDRFDLNRIHYRVLSADTMANVQSYRIADYRTFDSPYEGHYTHYDTQVSVDSVEVRFTEGDVIVPTDQPGIRYIIETLEPEAVDSFFNWNFFDPILQRKEGFSPYVFEDLAESMLSGDSLLRRDFEMKKRGDTVFAGDWYRQLDWLYDRSPYRESAYLHYPVYRIMD